MIAALISLLMPRAQPKDPVKRRRRKRRPRRGADNSNKPKGRPRRIALDYLFRRKTRRKAVALATRQPSTISAVAFLVSLVLLPVAPIIALAYWFTRADSLAYLSVGILLLGFVLLYAALEQAGDELGPSELGQGQS